MSERTCTIESCDRTREARGWCHKHYEHWRRYGDPVKPQPRVTASPEVRFWVKVTKTPGCWIWTAFKTAGGYGMFKVSSDQTVMAHRFAYESLRGPIPEGLELDHLCRVRECVNPDHLEPVTSQVNHHRSSSVGGVNARKTHCKRGHPFDEVNTYRAPNGKGRDCRACKRVRDSRRKGRA